MMVLNKTTCGSKHAFTLVELLAVVVIMGLVAGFSMMMVGHDDVYYAAGTARTIEQIIETAQQEAVRTQLYILVYFMPDIEYVVLMGYDKTTSQYKVLSNPFGGSSGTVIYVNLRDEINSNSYIGTVNLGSGSQSMSFSPMGEPLKSDLVTPLPDTNYILAGYGNKVFKLSIKPVTGTVRTTAY